VPCGRWRAFPRSCRGNRGGMQGAPRRVRPAGGTHGPRGARAPGARGTVLGREGEAFGQERASLASGRLALRPRARDVRRGTPRHSPPKGPPSDTSTGRCVMNTAAFAGEWLAFGHEHAAFGHQHRGVPYRTPRVRARARRVRAPTPWCSLPNASRSGTSTPAFRPPHRGVPCPTPRVRAPAPPRSGTNTVVFPAQRLAFGHEHAAFGRQHRGVPCPTPRVRPRARRVRAPTPGCSLTNASRSGTTRSRNPTPFPAFSEIVSPRGKSGPPMILPIERRGRAGKLVPDPEYRKGGDVYGYDHTR
jgi:hypothetical protein